MDPADVDLNEQTNQSYIQWLRSRGAIRTQVQDENDMAVNEKLVDALIGQQSRANTPVPPAAYRESAADKLTLEGATAVIGMVKKQAEGMTAVQTQSSDPMAILNGYATFAQTINSGNKSTELMIESLSRRLEASEERHAKLVDQLIQIKTAPPVVSQQQPQKSLLEQIKEAKELMDLLSPPAAEEAKSSSGSIKEQIIMKALDNAGPIMGGIGMLFDKAISGGVQAVAVAKGQPMPAVVAAPQAQTPAPPPQPQFKIPAGITEEQFRDLMATMSQTAVPMLEDFKLAVSGQSEPPVTGYTFAEKFIGWHGEVPAYTRIVAICKNPAGEVHIEPIIETAKQFPQFWNQVSSVEQEFRQFLTEFLTLKDLPQEDDGQQEGEQVQ
jgi:hypothetical protein